MKINVIVMGLIFTGLIFGPLIYLYYRGIAMKSGLRARMLMRAREWNMFISGYEIIANRIIGIDENSGKLVFIRNHNGNMAEQFVELTSAVSCTLLIDDCSIFLAIRKSGFDSESEIISFFDADDDPFVRGARLTSAMHWEGRINAVIENNFINPSKAA